MNNSITFDVCMSLGKKQHLRHIKQSQGHCIYIYIFVLRNIFNPITVIYL
jgi:hypothetical protein